MEEKESFLVEERLINEKKNVGEMIVRDVIRETERDMKATLREVEAKYLRQIAEAYKVDRKILREKEERARDITRKSKWI